MYLVIAYRFGMLEGYSFPVGIFNSLEEASNAAKQHRELRGGKYDHRMYHIEPGKEYDAEQCKSTWITGKI